MAGKNVQLGRSILKIVANKEQTNDLVFAGSEELYLDPSDNVTDYFSHDNFYIITNCAAYPAIDNAEEENELANQVHHLAVKHLAGRCRKKNGKLSTISADYAFDRYSDQPYGETDETNPINEYGKTKLADEPAIQEVMLTNAVIIRIGWVYPEFGNNFVKTMLRVRGEREETHVVSDKSGSVIYATDLTGVILELIDFQGNEKPTENYQYSNQGMTSWYDVSKQSCKAANIDCSTNSIITSEYPNLTRRLQNSLMDKVKIYKEIGINARSLNDSFDICIAKQIK